MIRALVPRDAERCDAIIRSLPDWFGNDQGIGEDLFAGRNKFRLYSARIRLGMGEVPKYGRKPFAGFQRVRLPPGKA